MFKTVCCSLLLGTCPLIATRSSYATLNQVSGSHSNALTHIKDVPIRNWGTRYSDWDSSWFSQIPSRNFWNNICMLPLSSDLNTRPSQKPVMHNHQAACYLHLPGCSVNFFFLPWRCRQNVPLNHQWTSTGLWETIFQKTVFLSVIPGRISPRYCDMCTHCQDRAV